MDIHSLTCVSLCSPVSQLLGAQRLNVNWHHHHYDHHNTSIHHRDANFHHRDANFHYCDTDHNDCHTDHNDYHSDHDHGHSSFDHEVAKYHHEDTGINDQEVYEDHDDSNERCEDAASVEQQRKHQQWPPGQPEKSADLNELWHSAKQRQLHHGLGASAQLTVSAVWKPIVAT